MKSSTGKPSRAERAPDARRPPRSLEKRLRQTAGRVVRRVRRLVLRPMVHRHLTRRRDDIEVVIVVRDRCDERIGNALRSIREQTYPERLVGIALVDYDSRRDLIPEYRRLCGEFNARYIRVDGQPVWCKSHGLNIAIRRSTATYTLSSDVDVILEPEYLAEAVDALKRKPFRVVFADFLDLPAMKVESLDYERLKGMARLRFGRDSRYAAPIPMTLTWFFKLIRGYDERYKYWGKEDDDLLKRFYMLGIDRYFLERSYLMHQWHPKHEGISEEVFAEHLEINSRYYDTTHSVVRNRDGWGIWEGREDDLNRSPAPRDGEERQHG